MHTVTLQPRAGVPALEAELYDGSDVLTLIWLGRRRITGIDCGRNMVVQRAHLGCRRPPGHVQPGVQAPAGWARVTEPRQGLAAITADDRFRAADALTPSALLDAGLPLALFTVIYTAAGRELTIALWAAIGAGVVLAAVRLVRREPLRRTSSPASSASPWRCSCRRARAAPGRVPPRAAHQRRVRAGLPGVDPGAVAAALGVRRPDHRAGFVVGVRTRLCCVRTPGRAHCGWRCSRCGSPSRFRCTSPVRNISAGSPVPA